jgi:hypothetical protein
MTKPSQTVVRVSQDRKEGKFMSNQGTSSGRKWLRWGIGIVLAVVALCFVVLFIYLLRDSNARIAEFEPLLEACKGRGVSETAAYQTTPGIHLVMAFKPSFGDNWVTAILAVPDEWEAKTLAETELVLCLSEQEEVLLERCPYGSLNEENVEIENIVERYQYSQELRLVEAQTGNLLAEETLTGKPPRECLDEEVFRSGQDTLTVKGEEVSNSQIKDWLEPHADIRE